MAAKRDYGSGSIKALGGDRYRLIVNAGTDVLTGKRVIVQETVGPTPVKAARARLAELVAEHARRGPTAHSATLARLITVWLESATHAKATRENYDRAVTRIPAVLLDKSAVRITPHEVQSLYNAISVKHGPNPTHQLHAVISGAYSHGLRLGWVHSNPARDRILPAIAKRKSTTPTVDEARRLIAQGADDEQKLWLRLAFVCGRRRSEVLAIRWSDIDLDAAVVRIERSLELDRTVKDTKTHDEVDIALDPRTVKMIRAWQRAQRERALAAGEPLADDPFLLSQQTDSSKPWRPDLATRRWSATRKRAKVRDNIRLQDFRKANSTQMISGGVDVRTAAGRSGHDPQMALGTYAGIVDEANRRAALVVARALDGDPEPGDNVAV